MEKFRLSATRSRIIVILCLSALLIAFGTTGYILLQGYTTIEALYMTVITLAAVGFTEVHPLDDTGRIFTIILIFLGVSFVAFTLAFFSRMMLDGNLLEAYRRRKLKKELDKLQNHYIICGYGQMGQIIAHELLRYRLPIVVIEKDETLLPRLREKGVLHIFGDATDEDNLLNAGLLRARGLVSVVAKDSENVFIVLTARDLNKDMAIFARASTAGSDKRLLKAGANRIVSPYVIGAIRLVHCIVRPTVTDFLELALSGEGMELSMEEICIPADSPLVGTELISSGIRSNYDLIIIAIKRSDGHMIFNPAPQQVLRAGDIMIALGPVENLARFGHEMFGHAQPSLKPCET